MKLNPILFFLLLTFIPAKAQVTPVIVGAASTQEYFPLLKDKKIAVLSNQTGMVGNEHLVDLLHRKGYNVVAIFSRTWV